MPLSKCVRCDNLFNKVESPVCEACRPDEDADFDLVRTALEENPDINATQVAELSGVDIECVLRMIDSGAITSDASAGMKQIKCGRCGAPAISSTKRLCTTCLEKLNREVTQSRKNIHIGSKKKVKIGSAASTSVRGQMDNKRRGS